MEEDAEDVAGPVVRLGEGAKSVGRCGAEVFDGDGDGVCL